ncbi:MAG: ribonuclease HII [Chloroflexota bacterium]|nr:ribonuclease HII [Chloroflexota bacterium]
MRCGINNIVGIDEVGRGTIAGPVVSASVKLSKDLIIGNPMKFNDSKKLSKGKRLKLFKEIIYSGSRFSIGIATNKEIDKYGIVESTKISMKRSIFNLKTNIDLILIDAINLDIKENNIGFNKADSMSVSVAAASIIAKVTRDSMMSRIYENLYPGYYLKENKGYGSKVHIESLNLKGASKIHRKSFSPINKM